MTAPTAQVKPALVVEELASEERMSQVHRRIAQFIKEGVSEVWLIDPEDQAITIYRPDRGLQILEAHEELAGSSVLPDFRSRVADFFCVKSE